MDKREFFKYSGLENSYLYEELLNSNERVYINFVPRQTGTTTSLAHYCFYKMFTSDKYEIAYILPSNSYSICTVQNIQYMLTKFITEYNKTNIDQLGRITTRRGEILFTANGQYIGKIKFYARIKYQILIGTDFDEIIIEDPLVERYNHDNYELIDWCTVNSNKVIIINNSYSLLDNTTDYITNTYKNIHYTPFLYFWHINIFEYQSNMLNTLGKDRFEKTCLMKGKMDYVRRI